MQAVVLQKSIPSVGAGSEFVSESRLERPLHAFQIGNRAQSGVAPDDHREGVVESEVRSPVQSAPGVGGSDGRVDSGARLLQRLMEDGSQRRAGVFDVSSERSRRNGSIADQ